jgi:hypothetical protein
MTNDLNLRYLEKEWLSGQPAERALRRMRGLSDKRLAVLLRHHDETEEGINDRDTWIRDDFDFLLGFYSIIEIAVMVGFVRKLPDAFSKKHLPVLNHPALRRYYEWNYPLDLPRRLRERILFDVGYHAREGTLGHAFFYEFLELTKAIERDKDMESFLWCLDGGYREDKKGASDLDAVMRELGKSNRLAEATQLSPKKRGELDRALNGFCKFIQFCECFDSLIQRLKEEPELAEAMWLAHGYWFRQLETDMGSNLKDAVLCLGKWRVGEKDKAALRARVAEINNVISRLAAPPTTRWKIFHPSSIEKRGEMLPHAQNVLRQAAAEGITIEFDKTALTHEENTELRKLLNMSVNEIDLSVRAANALSNVNIFTIGQLIEKTEATLLKYHNFGVRSLDEIKAKLREMGLRLGMIVAGETAGVREAEQAREDA